MFERYYNLRTFILLSFFIYFQIKILFFTHPSYALYYTENFIDYLYAFSLGVILINEFKVFAKAKEFKILIVFLMWAFILYTLNYWVNVSEILNVVFMTLVAFTVPFLLEHKHKTIFSFVVFLPLIILLLVLAVLGIYAFIINSDLRSLTPDMPNISLHEDQSRLVIYSHPNVTAIVFSLLSIISFAFLFYFKRKTIRILIIIELIMFFIIISLTQSRTSNLCYAFVVGLILACLTLNRYKTAQLKKKFIGFFSVLIATTVGVFFAFIIVLNIFNFVRISLSDIDFSSLPLVLQQQDIAEQQVSKPLINETVVEELAPQQNVQQLVIDINTSENENANEFDQDLDVGRDYSDVVHFNGRTGIWTDHIQIIKEYPYTIFFGFKMDPWDISSEVQSLTGNFFASAHNEYLYIILAFGIVGLILFVLFYLFIFLRIIFTIIMGKAFDNNFIIYAGIVIYIMITGLMESLFPFKNEIYSVVFFYCCGILCSCSKDINLKVIFGRTNNR